MLPWFLPLWVLAKVLMQRTTLDWKVVSKRLKCWISFQAISRANILPNKHTLIQIEAFQYDSFPSFNNTPPAVAFKPLAASNSIKRHRTPSATFVENGNELLAKVGRGRGYAGAKSSFPWKTRLFNKKEIYSLCCCSPSFPPPFCSWLYLKAIQESESAGRLEVRTEETHLKEVMKSCSKRLTARRMWWEAEHGILVGRPSGSRAHNSCLALFRNVETEAWFSASLR